MPQLPPLPVNRRRFVQLLGASAALAALPTALSEGAASAAGQPGAGAGTGHTPAPDPVAETYYRVLLSHTNWSETRWDSAKGHYTATDFGFAVVLGNAVLLTHGTYDADKAGVDAATLKDRTIASIRHFAGSNRNNGGTEWGKTLFFDTTFQLYFALAARLLWDDLDAATQKSVDSLIRNQAAYTTSLGAGDDPLSSPWTPNGLKGGWQSDTKVDEMGVYAQSLVPALVWAQDDPRYEDWLAAYRAWARNETGLPAADLANPVTVDGTAVSDNTGHNLWDTFLVENHGSFEPHYQEEVWRTSARTAIHYLTAGRALPQVVTDQPNTGPLWRSILNVMSDAGEPFMPMINDREHLYGRDVIPLAFQAQVIGDRAAAWAEQAMAERLEAYQAYPPEYRLAKFSGEPKYEPEARAEVAISYLLHLWAAKSGRQVQALSEKGFFEQASGVMDFGEVPGLLSHQSPAAWSAAVSKPGFVKFTWQPAHDDWLFKLSAATPMFLPATTGKVAGRQVRTYHAVRDGFDGSATVLDLGSAAYAGLTTLPSGAVVYATTGTGEGEGHLEVYNLTMPGVAGLTGSRTYRYAEGSHAVAAADSSGGATGGVRVDSLTFTRTQVRYLRVQGIQGDPTYGYSIYEFEVRDGGDGGDLARGTAATASSSDTGMGPSLAVDGSTTTRWAVSKGDRTRADSWLAVDLGHAEAVDRVTVRWEAAAGRKYLLQGSTDGQTWTDLVSWPAPDASSNGGWLDVDGRAGLVVRGSKLPLSVYGDTVVLADGPSGPLLVEGIPGASASSLRELAGRPVPKPDTDGVRAALTEGHLSLFNLTGSAVSTTVEVPASGTGLALFEGRQTVTPDGLSLVAGLDAASAVLLAPRFTLRPLTGGRLPAGLVAEVLDGATVRLSGPSCRVLVTGQGRSSVATVRGTVTVRLSGATAFPVDDLALGRTVFPTNPLPPGMSDPRAAVDGDPHTAWTPGPNGRMVVDLGSSVAFSTVRAEWAGGRVPTGRVEVSDDGLTYRNAGTTTGSGALRQLTTRATARYVALATDTSGAGTAHLVALTVR
ncbi:discoidin domain-containing protein [Streptomyces sp. NBC_00440]|uniref:discoidin domain-containing protein n=1 Tax=Streptomyces sp. NBC_00440 TaxID=2975741 RepID=UPI002E1C8A71